MDSRVEVEEVALSYREREVGVGLRSLEEEEVSA